MSEEDRAQILALSRDLSLVWNADTTTNAERESLLRMLVREITLTPVDVPARSTRVQMLWQTGAVSELAVTRTDRFTVHATPPRALAFIRGALDHADDAQIAAELNRRGLRTAAGQSWTKQAVQRARYGEGLHRASPRARRAPASVAAQAVRRGSRSTKQRYGGFIDSSWR